MIREIFNSLNFFTACVVLITVSMMSMAMNKESHADSFLMDYVSKHGEMPICKDLDKDFCKIDEGVNTYAQYVLNLMQDKVSDLESANTTQVMYFNGDIVAASNGEIVRAKAVKEVKVPVIHISLSGESSKVTIFGAGDNFTKKDVQLALRDLIQSATTMSKNAPSSEGLVEAKKLKVGDSY